jgi:hypothetical protein
LLTACAIGAIVVAEGVGQARPLAEPLPRADTDTGYLDVSSDPPAKIIIDEVDWGRMTPAQHLPLKPGHHKLTLVTPEGGKRRNIGFTVESGQTTRLSIHLAS